MAFGIIPREALSDPDLTGIEFKVLAGLYSFCDGVEGEIWPSREALGERVGIENLDSLSRVITRLEKKGWVKRVGKKSYSGPKIHRLGVPERLKLPPPKLYKSDSIETVENVQFQPPDTVENLQYRNCTKFTADTVENLQFDTVKNLQFLYEETNEETIEDKKIDKKNITDVVNEKLKPPPASNPDRFDEFYSAYPRKVGKANAAKAWKKLKPSTDLINQILIDIEQRVSTGAWSLDQKQFIPHPATYLNGERWEDEINPMSQPSGRTWLTPNKPPASSRGGDIRARSLEFDLTDRSWAR